MSYQYTGESSISLEQAVNDIGYNDAALERALSSRGASGKHVGPAPGYHWLSNDNSWRLLLNEVKYRLEKNRVPADIAEDYEEVEPNKELADKAWMLNLIISNMNNEEAYYGGWLYIWPDGESKEECLWDFGDEESYKELEDTFIRKYKAYHEDGLYGKYLTQEIIDAAHEWDNKLGLSPIEVL